MEMLLIVGGVVATIAMFAIGLIATKEDEKVQDRISSLSRTDRKVGTIREKALEASFTERVLFPFAQNFFDKTQKIIPLSNKSWVRTKLVQAGYLKPHYPKVFLGIQLLATCIIFIFFTTLTTVFGKVSGPMGIGLSFFFSMAGYGFPMIWLKQEAEKRQQSIQKSLPDFLDLLVICVEAGLGLDTAITKLSVMKSARTSTYLREELIRYTKDISFGKPRREALLDMANRTGVEDFQTIINALVQAYEMGTGVSHTLRVQSDSLRVKRLQKAEEKANKIPVKMVLPIYFFLFPAIFVSIFGPIGMIVVKSVVEIFAKISLN